MSGSTLLPPMPESLRQDLQMAAASAVKRRDLPALQALHTLRVNLEGALERAARNGYHEITRGLRRLNVRASNLAVMFAVERSEESYWSLAEPDAAPPLPTFALEEAVGHSQWTLVHKLLTHYRVQPTVRAVERLPRGMARRPPPPECVRALFEGLPEPQISAQVLRGAAALLDTPRFEKLWSRASGVNLQSLLVPAFRAGNTANFYALLHAGAALEGSLIGAYFSPPPYLSREPQQEERAMAFIETLGSHLGPVLSLVDLAPAIHSFLVFRVNALGVAGVLPQIQAQPVSTRWAAAIVSALHLADHSRIGVLLESLVEDLRGSVGQPLASESRSNLLQQFTELFNQQLANCAAPTGSFSP